jgi:ABC-type phosphate/phosphonate transport system substrate-binding protein
MRAGRWVRRNRVLAGLVATVAAAVLLGAWLGFDKWETGELQRQFAIDFVQQREDLNNGRVEYIHLTPVILAAATGKRATHQPNATRLRIGIYTELGQMENIIKLTPFLRKIEQEVSRTCPVRIELFEYRRRESMESDFLQDRLDVIRIGEGPLARLRRHDLAITPLVQQVGGGKTSVVFVAASSSIRRIEELKGTSFIAGSPTATSSGFKLLEILLEAGVNADNIRLTYRNNSENNLEAVLRGEFPAGVTRKDKLVGSLTNHFRTLKEFPTTTMPWAARANLDSGIAPAFTAALVNTKDPKILRNLPDDASGGFKPADLEYFEWLDGQIRKIEEQFFGSEGIDGYLKRK